MRVSCTARGLGAPGTRPDSTVSVLLGNGSGNFFQRADFRTGSGPNSVAIDDLNVDGKTDLAVANLVSNTVSVLLGNGNGNFRPKEDFGTESGPSSVAIGDLTGDGRPDLAVANLVSSTLSLFLGNGDGNFRPKAAIGSGRGTVSVAIDDVNADRRPDVVAANAGSNTVSVLLGGGDGTFFQRDDFGTGSGPNSVAIGDLTGDGRPDLAVSNFSSTVSVLQNRGTNPVAVAVADLEATVFDQRVQIRWRLSPEARQDLQGIAIERATTAAGPYNVRSADLLEPAIEMTFEDVDLQSGSYWYRLVLVAHDGSRVLAGPVSVQVGPGASRLTALDLPFEPAGGGPIQIRFSLGARVPVRLAVHDVRGRLLWSSERSVQEPGQHTQTWDRGGPLGTPVSRGVYFVVLDADGVRQSRKLLLVRR